VIKNIYVDRRECQILWECLSVQRDLKCLSKTRKAAVLKTVEHSVSIQAIRTCILCKHTSIAYPETGTHIAVRVKITQFTILITCYVEMKLEPVAASGVHRMGDLAASNTKSHQMSLNDKEVQKLKK